MIFSTLLFLLSSAALNLHIYVLQLFLSEFSTHFQLSSRQKISEIEPSGLVFYQKYGNQVQVQPVNGEWMGLGGHPTKSQIDLNTISSLHGLQCSLPNRNKHILTVFFFVKQF